MTKKELIALGQANARSCWSRIESSETISFATSLKRPEATREDATKEACEILAAGNSTRAEAYQSAYIAEFVSLWSTHHNELPEVKAANKLQSLKWMLDGDLRSTTEDLAAWAKRFAENPQDAFEWANGAIEAAARQWVARHLQAVLESAGYEAAMKVALREALRGAKYPSHSTSAVSNIANEAKTVAFAYYVERIGDY